MIKSFKIFENINNIPEVGNWCCVEVDPELFDWVKNSDFLMDFFRKNAGVVRNINDKNNQCLIEFFPKTDNEKKILNVYSKQNGYKIGMLGDTKYSYHFFPEEIEYFSENKEYVEMYMIGKKYNL